MKVHNEYQSVVFAAVNLTEEKKSFAKLQLTQYPCAVYLESGYYYNYTGPFNTMAVYYTVVNGTYLRTQPYPSPRPLRPLEYLQRIYVQIVNKNAVVWIYIGILSLILGILGFSFCWGQLKQKQEIKDE